MTVVYYLNDAKSVLITQSQILGEEPDAYFDQKYVIEESLFPMILESLPWYFRRLKAGERYWVEHDRLVLAVSESYRVSVVHWHESESFAVNVEVIRDTPEAFHSLPSAAQRIFDALAQTGLVLQGCPHPVAALSESLQVAA